jgi:hypothetical protein
MRSRPLAEVIVSTINPTPACIKPPYTPTRKNAAREIHLATPVGGKWPPSFGGLIGFQNTQPAAKTKTNDKILWKARSPTIRAAPVPNTAPIRAGGAASFSQATGTSPLLRKVSLAPIPPLRTAIRFVAFATVGGKPKKISRGRVNKEPPPAIELTVPAANPARNRIRPVITGSVGKADPEVEWNGY